MFMKKLIILFVSVCFLSAASCETERVVADADYVVFGRILGDATDYIQTFKYQNGQLYEDDMPNIDKVTRFKSTAIEAKKSEKIQWLMSDLSWITAMQGTHTVGECNSCIDKTDFYIEWNINGKSGQWQIGELRENEITTTQKAFIEKLRQAYSEIKQ
jgi:hypothetical protein